MGKSESVSSNTEDRTEEADAGSSESDENEYQVIRPTKIERLLRDQTELQVSPEADEVMVEALNEVAAVIAAEAIKVAERKSGGSTVKPHHVETAYDQIKKPHNTIFRAINQINEARDQVRAAAEASPFSDVKIND
ncbi:histone-like protein [Haladaptatus sp. DYF46]|uniref:histone-like protein n=1 Tax=Haladaptatus sp. DYF46 TaxID=2886041 RepID=UPI001E3FFB98|nr:histone-like protein [Haladaptatus sp. DYF46]